MTFEFDDFRDGYLELVDAILTEGHEVSPRGMRTKELTGVTFTVNDVDTMLVAGVGRNLKYEIGAAESVGLVGGLSDAQMLVNSAKNFAMFVEDDRLQGAYGPRVHRQWLDVLKRLHDDPDTRQAVLALWRPGELVAPTKDLPCTLAIGFTIRDGAVDAHAVMRSNDIFWGTPYDVWMFTSAQRAVAAALGLHVGRYTHTAFSLHAYIDRDSDALSKLHRYDGTLTPPPLLDWNLFPSSDWNDVKRRWAQIVAEMECIAGVGIARQIYSNPWYANLLEPVLSNGEFCGRCRYVLPTLPGDLCADCARDVRREMSSAPRHTINKGVCTGCGATEFVEGCYVDGEYEEPGCPHREAA